MKAAYDTLRNAMGSYTWDHDFAHTKGFMEGYIAGMEKVKRETDL